MSSGPAAFPFRSFLIAFVTSCSVGASEQVSVSGVGAFDRREEGAVYTSMVSITPNPNNPNQTVVLTLIIPIAAITVSLTLSLAISVAQNT